MMEFPGRTQSRRLWAFTTQEIGPAGIAGKAREKALPELYQVSGHSQVSVPESLLWDWPRVLTRAPPSTPPSLRGTSHHPCPLVFNSSKLCCPSPVCSPSCVSAHRVAPSQLALFSEEARGLNLAFKAPHTLVPSCCPSRMPLAAWHLTCQPL